MKTSSTVSAGTDTVTTLALSQMGILNKKKAAETKLFWKIVGGSLGFFQSHLNQEEYCQMCQ